MRNSWLVVLVCSGWLAAPVVAGAQAVDQEDSETLRAVSRPGTTGESPDTQQAARLIVAQTNQFREDQGLESVETDPELTAAAQYFAAYMAKTNKYGHTADGKRPADRARQHGYEYCIVLENIAYQYSSAGFTTEELVQNFVKGWKESPGHRKNMLDADVAQTGVAVAQSEETSYFYAVQMFGRPKSQSIEFTIANQSDQAIAYQIGEQTLPLPPRYIRTHERCRPSELTFLLGDGPQAKAKTQTVRPTRGDQFVVQGAQGQLQVQVQEQ